VADVGGNRRVRAFRATDAFALETYRVSRFLDSKTHRSLVDEIRRAVVRSGGALVAASAADPGGADERRYLERARRGLLEGRYYIYIARRIGLLDLKRYRSLTVRQDVALRELDELLGPRTSEEAVRPP